VPETSLTEEGILGLVGTRKVFSHWIGDSAATTSGSFITMDGPKTVKAVWVTDYSQAYLIIGALIIALVIIIYLLIRRR
jgi:hypothetical protein